MILKERFLNERIPQILTPIFETDLKNLKHVSPMKSYQLSTLYINQFFKSNINKKNHDT